MTEVLTVIISMSISGSLLGLIVLLLKKSLKNHVSSTWQYFVWLIIIARLLFPFSPPISFYSLASGSVSENNMTSYFAINNAEKEDILTSYGENSPAEPFYKNPNQKNKLAFLDLTAYTKYTWIVLMIGSAFFSIRKVRIYKMFLQSIKIGSVPVNDSNILSVYKDVCKVCGVYKIPPLFYTPHICTPMIVGFVAPAIFLPQQVKGNLEHILIHEITHYKRHDIFNKFIAQAALCLHWFNPLVWLFTREMDKDCELACDEHVMSLIDKKHSYGTTLLTSLIKDEIQPSQNALFLSGKGKILKERLDNIMKYNGNKSRKVTTFVTVIVVFLAVFMGCATVKAFSSEENISSSGVSKYKLDDYQNMSLLDFDQMLLDDYDAAKKTIGRFDKNDKDIEFYTSLILSMAEVGKINNVSGSNISNVEHIESNKEGNTITLAYTITWSIPDMTVITVKERDDMVLEFRKEIYEAIDQKLHEGAFAKVDTNDIKAVYSVVRDNINNVAESLSTKKMSVNAEEYTDIAEATQRENYYDEFEKSGAHIMLFCNTSSVQIGTDTSH